MSSTQTFENKIGLHVGQLLRQGEANQVNGDLAGAMAKALEGHCIYLPAFVTPARDYTLMLGLTGDLEAACAESDDEGMVS
jgi:hypothetical protein